MGACVVRVFDMRFAHLFVENFIPSGFEDLREFDLKLLVRHRHRLQDGEYLVQLLRDDG